MKWMRKNKTEKWNPFNYRTFPDEQEKHKDVSVHEEHVQHLHDVNGLVTKEEETRKTGTFVRLHARARVKGIVASMSDGGNVCCASEG